jgi:hypothetical protein
LEKNDYFSIELDKEDDPTLSVMPISVHCSSTCNLVIWLSPKIEVDKIVWTEVRFDIALKMDQLADLLRDHQYFSPLIAIIDIDDCTEENVRNEWLQLTGDQDWHRGRFIVQIANTKSYPTVKEHIEKWTGALQVKPYSPKKIDNNRFKELILDAIPSAKIPTGIDPQLFARYTDNVFKTLEHGQVEKMAENWKQEIVDDLNNLLGTNFFEGTNNDA